MSKIYIPGTGWGGGGGGSSAAVNEAAFHHTRHGDGTKGSTNDNIVKFGTAVGTPDSSVVSHNDSTYLTDGSIFTLLEDGVYDIRVSTSAATAGFGVYILSGTSPDNTLQTIIGGETQPINATLCSFTNSRKVKFSAGDKIWVYCDTVLADYGAYNYLHAISIVKLTKGEKGDPGPAFGGDHVYYVGDDGEEFSLPSEAYAQAVLDGRGLGNPAEIRIAPGSYTDTIDIDHPCIHFISTASADGIKTVEIDGDVEIDLQSANPGDLRQVIFDGISINGKLSVLGDTNNTFKTTIKNLTVQCTTGNALSIDAENSEINLGNVTIINDDATEVPLNLAKGSLNWHSGDLVNLNPAGKSIYAESGSATLQQVGITGSGDVLGDASFVYNFAGWNATGGNTACLNTESSGFVLMAQSTLITTAPVKITGAGSFFYQFLLGLPGDDMSGCLASTLNGGSGGFPLPFADLGIPSGGSESWQTATQASNGNTLTLTLSTTGDEFNVTGQITSQSASSATEIEFNGSAGSHSYRHHFSGGVDNNAGGYFPPGVVGSGVTCVFHGTIKRIGELIIADLLVTLPTALSHSEVRKTITGATNINALRIFSNQASGIGAGSYISAQKVK